MTKERKELLVELLEELREERMNDYVDYDLDEVDVYELDDGDNLLQGIDIVLGAV